MDESQNSGLISEPGRRIQIDSFVIQAKLANDSKPVAQRSSHRSVVQQSIAGEGGAPDADEIINRCLELLEQRLDRNAER